MPKVSDLFRQTRVLIDNTMDNQTMADWFNFCNQQIMDIVYIPAYVPLTKVNGVLTMPSNVNGELQILEPAIGKEYAVYDGEIHFTGEEAVNSVKVYYNRMMADISTDSDYVPELNAKFHGIYPNFAAMQYMLTQDEDTLRKRYEAEFTKYRYQIEKYYARFRVKPDAFTVER